MTTAWRNRIVGTGEEAPDQLVGNPMNWRTHPGAQRDALRGSLGTVGWVQQILVNQRTGHVVDGHARVEEALSRHEATVPVLYVDLDLEEERLVLATLDPIGAMAAQDDARLKELLADLNVDDAGLQALLDSLGGNEPKAGLADPDDAPPLGDDSGIKPGDLFALGDHRLMCGDSTKGEDVGRLMGGVLADLIVTDPPYGVAYDGGTKIRERLVGDESSDLYAAALPLLLMAPGSSLYLFFSMAHVEPVLTAVKSTGWDFRTVLIWNKNNAVFGVRRGAHYHAKYEPFMFATRGSPVRWYGPSNEVTVWDIDRAPSNDFHPTQKPVELIERALTNSSAGGATVADPFVGSGTTIIAAEQLGRRCYAMEIDPRYVAVAIKRWEDFTGRVSERIDG